MNEVNKQVKENTDAIAKISAGSTKTVGDINDLNADIKADTTVGAINNVDNKVGDISDLSADIKADTTVGAINNVNDKVNLIGGKLNRLDSKINKVGAGAAALAALHPMDFDPDNKLTFSAGIGNYHGENAAAIGAFYRPNEQIMFSVAGNMGNGENMVNAGITFALDRPSQATTSKAVMAKKLAAQEQEIASQKAEIAEQNARIAKLEAMLKELAAQTK